MILQIILGSSFLLLVLAALFWMWKMNVTAKPDEWMLVIRNGKVIQQGVGLSRIMQWGD